MPFLPEICAEDKLQIGTHHGVLIRVTEGRLAGVQFDFKKWRHGRQKIDINCQNGKLQSSPSF